MNASALNSSPNLFSQLLLPLQGVVDFFSPPVPSRSAFKSAAIGAQPRLAKAPVMPTGSRTAATQSKIQPAGIRLDPKIGIRLVGTSLMGEINNPATKMTAEQILRSRRAQDGRIVISGRMRDVCAELDRLCDERV